MENVNEQELKQDIRHIQLPNEISLNKQLSPIDCLVYVTIRSFNGKNGCFPSIQKIAETAGVSHMTVKKSVKKLESIHAIKIDCQGKGSKTYYTFPKPLFNDQFEPFSYDFLLNRDIEPNVKGYLIMALPHMFKNSESQATIVDNSVGMCKKINVNPRTLRKYENTLLKEGILSIINGKDLDEVGCKK